MLSASQIGNPHFRSSDKERKRADSHYDGQRSPCQSDFRKEYPQKSKDTDCHNQYAKTAGEAVGIVLYMPPVLGFVKLSLFQLVFLVFRCRLIVEETHKRTVCHERNDSFGFVVPEFQAAYPYKYHKNGHADEVDTQLLGRSGQRQCRKEQFLQFRFHIFVVLDSPQRHSGEMFLQRSLFPAGCGMAIIP